jgi:Na+/H+ antiporter NhaD/arsenite permease-like protein
MGMMIIVGVHKTTGVFEAVSAYIVKISKGNFIQIFVMILVATALLSGILDNVTTVLLFSPIVFLICQEAEVDPKVFAFPMIFASNIGGTLTLIGDPPNILIGNASHTGFVEFFKIMAVPTLLSLVISIFIFLVQYKEIKSISAEKLAKLSQLDPKKAITDYKLLIKGSIIFALVILGFVLKDKLQYESSVIALAGAALMLIFSKTTFEHIAKDIEWDTIFFFIGLFIIVKGLEEVNIIADVAAALSTFASHPFMMIMTVLALSAVLSSFIGAVPVVTIFIPVLEIIIPSVPKGYLLWWALALGANFASNTTIVASACNMVVVGLLESNFKEKVSFFEFMKKGIPITMMGLAISALYLTGLFYLF